MKRIYALVVFLLVPLAHGAAGDYPQILSLSRDDMLFVQLEDDIESFYRISRQREPESPPPLGIFTYQRKQTEDLFSLNARLNLSYETLATLNGIESPQAMGRLDSILISSQPGIFVSDPPRTELEQMILGSRLQQGKLPRKVVVWRCAKRQNLSFFPGSQFSDVERAFFLRILFRFPIAEGSITSRYGPRQNPFSGHPEFHGGIDIGAHEGTEVHAARDGTVSERAVSPILGNYLVVSHPGGYQTVYGHLSAFNVTLGQEVSAGSVIGRVGNTGLATGPHLHFEVRNRGATEDPFLVLRVKR